MLLWIISVNLIIVYILILPLSLITFMILYPTGTIPIWGSLRIEPPK